jgi:16S rRNA (cytosine1407-C5)-methyltransferase
LQKGEVEEAALSVKKNRSKGTGNQKKQPAIPEYVQTYLQNVGDYTFYLDRRERICAMKKGAMADLRLLEEHLRMVHAGIVIGEVKGKDLLPDISLALSVALNRDAVKSVSLGRKDAIRYLRGEAFVLPENSPLGWVLVMFEDHPLGWMKNIGNRANNAYPNEWRIRAENPFPISQQ